jgi:hypothetical protein
MSQLKRFSDIEIDASIKVSSCYHLWYTRLTISTYTWRKRFSLLQASNNLWYLCMSINLRIQDS